MNILQNNLDLNNLFKDLLLMVYGRSPTEKTKVCSTCIVNLSRLSVAQLPDGNYFCDVCDCVIQPPNRSVLFYHPIREKISYPI